MNVSLKTLSCAALVASVASTAAVAADNNPIFGGAKTTALSATESANVTGKGANANYYGYYGYYYANLAKTYSYNARYVYATNSTSETASYYYAYQAATYSAAYSYVAYYYSSKGQ
jgi:hypothetical protein